MNTEEKIELLKGTIFQLYCKEGRSKSYISKLLSVNRTKLAKFIEKENFEKSNIRHMNKSTEKFINSNRTFISSRLKEDVNISEIAKQLHIDRKTIYTAILHDKTLSNIYNEYKNRLQNKKDERTEKSSRNYSYEEIEGEVWKDLLGYENYSVSNKGRVRKYCKRYKKHFLLSQEPNKNNGRLYVRIKDNNLQVSRLVGFSFVEGHSESANTINHKNGIVSDNRSENLEWVSQSDNNKHSYNVLNRRKVNLRKYKFDKIVYKDKFEFKTVSAFSRFIGKSETQTRRYLENPSEHEIKLISNCND